MEVANAMRVLEEQGNGDEDELVQLPQCRLFNLQAGEYKPMRDLNPAGLSDSYHLLSIC